MRPLGDYLTRANFAHALGDPAIDQAELAVKVTQFEQRRRRELALEALPEPDSYDIRASHLLVRIGR